MLLDADEKISMTSRPPLDKRCGVGSANTEGHR